MFTYISAHVIINIMKVKPLSETNPYLKDPVIRAKVIARSVETSCGVEGIKTTKAAHIDIPSQGIKRIYLKSKP